jgi:hypothetical protein
MRHLLVALLFAVVGCGGGDGEEEAYDTLDDCFVDHTQGDEGLPVVEALIVCCLEHPIDGVAPSCGATVEECEDHVGSEISVDEASDREVAEACEGYVDEL